MKAAVYTEFGPPEVLRLQEVEKPAPKDNEVLIRVHAASVNYGDIVARNFANIPSSEFHMPLLFLFPTRFYFGLRKPRITILGAELAGEIEA
ncbi:MAG: NAD(P)-dependent alcohol dehydrogenase, partial [Fidelibacterota bacterium]